MTSLARYVWHPNLHIQSGERLYFVRFYFEPTYPDVLEELAARLRRLDVGSVHVYDLVGAYDLILRLWYAGDIRDLITKLDLPDMRRADFMEVRRTHEHWVLTSQPADIDPQLSDLTPEQVETINAQANKVDGEELDKYVEEGFIAPVPLSGGVKFFVSVVASIGTSSSIKFDDILFKHVSDVLDDAGDLVQGRSVYAGDGFARFLLMGRFDSERYFEFTEKVVVKLNNEYMRELFNARTFTAFGAQQSPLLGTDVLDPERVAAVSDAGQFPAEDVGTMDLQALLTAGEGQYVEVKGSAFLDIERLVHDGVPDWSKLRPEFVKAVCGLLNQRERRRCALIVGALETERYKDWLARHPEDLLEIGDFTIIGIEEDNPSGDWDKYQRRLADALASAIDPSPLPYMTIALEEHAESDGRKVLALRIELTPVGKPFYDKDGSKLWIRQGAQVKPLQGTARDEYVSSLKRD